MCDVHTNEVINMDNNTDGAEQTEQAYDAEL